MRKGIFKRKKTSLVIKLLRAVSSMVISFALIYMLFFGFSLLAGTAIAVAAVTVAAPIVASGGEGLEMLLEFFVALAEGIATAVEALISAIASIFN